MALSLADMVMIGLRLIQYRTEISLLFDKIFGPAASRASGSVAMNDAQGVTHQYDVKWVQMALNHLCHKAGVALAVDGVMGEQTRAAIKDYQDLKGLTADGWLGPVTMARLEADIRRAHAGATR